MRPKRILRLGFFPALCCLLAILLSGCGNSNHFSSKPSQAPDSQQVYRYGDIASDISTFDPAEATDQPSIEAITMVFTGLVQLDDNLQVQPQLAQSYSISPDGLTYTFHLRPDLKFSDGTALTASDVAYSIDRALSPAVADVNGVTLTYLGLIKDAHARVSGQLNTLIGDSVNVIDASTIQLVVSAQTSYFLQALTYPTAYVVEQSVINQWGRKWTDHLGDHGGQGGDGPFKVLSHTQTGIIFVPNPNYYGPHPRLQRVEFDFYKTPETAYLAYLANQLDFVKRVPPTRLSNAHSLPNNQYTQISELAVDYIAMNYLYKPFDNVHIRQAFELAINKDAINKAIYDDTRVSTCHIIPAGMRGYNSDVRCPYGAPTSGDATKARALFQQGLREEGLSLATFPQVKITYASNNPALAEEITTMIQQWQQVLGVGVLVQTMDFLQILPAESQTLCPTPDDLAECQNRGLQMWAAAWGADYPDPQDWTSLQFGKGSPNNQSNYGQNLSSTAIEQQQVQRRMPLADVETDLLTRLSMYNQIEQQLVNDVAWMPLDQRDTTAVLKPYVIGQVYNALSLIPPNDWGSIYIAAH